MKALSLSPAVSTSKPDKSTLEVIMSKFSICVLCTISEIFFDPFYWFQGCIEKYKIYNINLVKNLQKPDLSSMMDKASIAAALNCKKIGCNPPSREDIEIFINKENFENNA